MRSMLSRPQDCLADMMEATMQLYRNYGKEIRGPIEGGHKPGELIIGERPVQFTFNWDPDLDLVIHTDRPITNAQTVAIMWQVIFSMLYQLRKRGWWISD